MKIISRKSAIVSFASCLVFSTISLAGEINTNNLWAGAPTVAIDRYSNSLCGDGAQRLSSTAVNYDEWARQRAGFRRICFQVWMPGVTDAENNDYWKKLDVQVHVIADGKESVSYVNSVGRTGNNRIYAWDLQYQMDPFVGAPNMGGVMLGLLPKNAKLIQDGVNWAQVSVPVEFFFTVNGNKLSSETNSNFILNYVGQARKTLTREVSQAQVLYPQLSCEGGLTVGTGAGFNAVEVLDSKAAEELAGKLTVSNRYEGLVTKWSNSGKTVTSLLSSSSLPGQPNEIVFAAGFNTSVTKVTLVGTVATVEVLTGLKSEIVEWKKTFLGCKKN